MRIEIQRSCTIASASDSDIGGRNNPVSVDCTTNTPYAIEIVPFTPNRVGETRNRASPSTPVDATPPSASPSTTYPDAIVVTVRY